MKRRSAISGLDKHQREQRFCFLQASLPQTQIGETAQGLQTRPGAVEGIAATAAKM